MYDKLSNKKFQMWFIVKCINVSCKGNSKKMCKGGVVGFQIAVETISFL